ncbi:MAG: hypothetical protein J6H18_05590 [Lachnospiraceae bacterium]|nr:hypothetical protein [Lachnospiraceae bacterium]
MKRMIQQGLCLMCLCLLAGCGGGGSPTEAGTYVRPIPISETPRSTQAPETETPRESGMPAQSETAEPQPSGTAAPHTAVSTGEAPGARASSQETREIVLGSFTEEDLIFSYRNRQIRTGEAFAVRDFEEDWGAALTEKGQACIGGGFDENYYFGEYLSVMTLGDSGSQIVYDIYVTETGYATARGAVIGQTTREELPGIYGIPTASMGATDRYILDGVVVSFTFSGGILSEIDYNSSMN